MTDELIRYLASYLEQNAPDIIERDYGGFASGYFKYDTLVETIKTFFRELP
jgi:hypothetical protein